VADTTRTTAFIRRTSDEQAERSTVAPSLGAQSEVGVLRTVLVHRPDLAHERLSPTNRRELLFDEVIWARRARQEFDAFVDVMREAGVEVLLLHELLAEAMLDAGAREWLLSRRLRPEEVTAVYSRELTAWMNEMRADELATRLTGGVTAGELPGEMGTLVQQTMRPTDFVIAPLPNHLFPRDTSAWIYGGISINPMHQPARQHESLNVEAVYRFHPRFRSEEFPIWFGGVDHDWGGATLDGGDVMPLGEGVLLVGQGERSNARAVSILAQNLFAAGAARLVIGAQLPRERAALPLDTVLTFCDRDVVTIHEPIVSRIAPILYTPDGSGGVHAELAERSLLEEMQEALGLERLVVVTTGADEFETERSQWDDGNNVVALAPGVIVAFERNEATNSKLVRAGVDVHEIAGQELGRAHGGGHRMTCPITRDP
jgi:arginine deiminase